MTNQPSEGRDNFEPASEISEESFMPDDGYGAEPEKRRSLASHHRSHRHHSSSGSSSSSYRSSSGGYSGSSGSYNSTEVYSGSSGGYSGNSDSGYGRSNGSYSSSDAGYGRSQGGYSDGYSAGYEAGYRSSRQRSSQGDYSDGYSAGFEAGYRSSHSSHSHHHSSHHSDGYDDGYGSGYSSSHHHSSHRSSRSSSSGSGSKPGRLASHHRSRRHHHHHHHTEGVQTDQNYVSTYESLPIETGRIGIGTDVEAVEIPPTLEEMKNLPYDDQAIRLEDIHYAGSGQRPEDVYYADRGQRPEDVYYADRGQRPEDVYYADRGQRPEDVYYADRGRDAGQRNDTGQDTVRTPGPLASTIVTASAINPPKTYDASTIESSGSRRRRKKQQKRQTLFGILTKILIFFIVLLIAAIGGLVFLRIKGEQSMKHKAEDVVLTMEKENTPVDVEEIEDDGKTITYKGEKYRWNDNVSTILFLGSDRTVEQQEARESVIGINGQADTILLSVIDNKNKKISFINVNRDTMTNVAQYAPDGDYAGDKQMQICLAYSYGKDNVQSCERMAAAVSNLLFGIPIDSYVRISYDAVPMLNDSVGGVKVEILEDMSSTDPTLVKGSEVMLVGSQALRYIRWRNYEVTETNELRMARQKQYFYAFIKKTIEETRSNLTVPLELYNNAKPYMTTNITPSRVTYLTSKVLEYGVKDDAIHSVKGGSIDGPTGLVEFYADDDKLFEMVLDMFYIKANK